MFDIIIKDSFIVDGTGNKIKKSDIGIRNGIIEEIGDLQFAETKRTIFAEGLYTAPGFIDVHSHQDLFLLAEPSVPRNIHQGITTSVIGNCGLGVVPLKKLDYDILLDTLSGILGNYNIKFDWTTLDEYFKKLSTNKIGVNVAALIPHNALRIYTLGRKIKAAKSDIKQMKKLLTECYEMGAVGFSTGLVYAPNCFATLDELIELCNITKKYDRIFAIHIRNEGPFVLKAIKEAINIAKVSEVRLQISHLKIYGEKNQNLIDEILELLEEETDEGMEINFDSYPYTYGSTSLVTLLPKEYKNVSSYKLIDLLSKETERAKIKKILQQEPDINAIGLQNIIINSIISDRYKKFECMNLIDIAKELKKDWTDVLCDILIADNFKTSMLIYGISEEVVKKVMVHPYQMFGTDGLFGDRLHPRAYGTYPRIIKKYVIDEKVLSLENAIKKMTYEPAQKLRLHNRGAILKAYYADLVIFDKDKITDTATIQNPKQYPVGICYVLVNGIITLDNGVHTNQLSGKVITHP